MSIAADVFFVLLGFILLGLTVYALLFVLWCLLYVCAKLSDACAKLSECARRPRTKIVPLLFATVEKTTSSSLNYVA
jgi:hypothetical protein